MITNFENVTNPGQTPVDGDLVNFQVNGKLVADNWDLNLLIRLIGDHNESANLLSKIQFRRLFPQSTNLAYDNFEQNDLISDVDKQQLRTIKASFDASTVIDISDPDMLSAMMFFVYLGFMTQADMDSAMTLGLS